MASSTGTSEPTSRWAVAALFVFSLACSLYQSDAKSLWMDEGLSLNITQSWSEFWQRLVEIKGGSWLYYTLFFPWRHVAETETGFRAFSALCAAGAVIVVYFIGIRLRGRQAGFLAGIALACHPLFVQYAQDTRAYALVLLLVCLNGLCILRALEHRTLGSWIACAFIGFLCSGAHFLAVFAVAAQLTGAAVLWRREVAWPGFLACVGILCAGLALQVVVFSPTSVADELAFIPPIGTWQIPRFFTAFSGGGRRLEVAYYLTVAIAALAWTVIHVRWNRSTLHSWVRLLWLLGWLAAPPIANYAFSYVVTPAFIPRYMLSALPAAALLVGFVLADIRPRLLSAVLASAILIIQVIGLNDWYAKPGAEDWRAAGTYFRTHAGPKPTVLAFRYFSDAPFRFYADLAQADARGTPWNLPGKGWVYWWKDGNGTPVAFSDVPARIGQLDTFWLVLAHDNLELADGTATRDQLLSVLEGFEVVDEQSFQGVRLRKYQRPSAKISGAR